MNPLKDRDDWKKFLLYAVLALLILFGIYGHSANAESVFTVGAAWDTRERFSLVNGESGNPIMDFELATEIWPDTYLYIRHLSSIPLEENEDFHDMVGIQYRLRFGKKFGVCN